MKEKHRLIIPLEQRQEVLTNEINSFMTKAVIIWKSVHLFALQINGLVSI